MADIGATQIGDARARAPVARDLFLGAAERWIILGNLAHAAEHQSGGAAHIRGGENMRKASIDPIKVFADFLDHQHMIGEIGLALCADHIFENGEVERERRPMRSGRLDALRAVADQKIECAPRRRFPAWGFLTVASI